MRGLYVLRTLVACTFVVMSCWWNCVCQLSLLQLLICAGYRHFFIYCLRLFVVYKLVLLIVVVLVMCILAFIVTSACITQLWVYLIYCLRLFVVVYKFVMFLWCS